MIGRCVNNDIAKKITNMIKIDLTDGTWLEEGYFKLRRGGLDDGASIWMWDHIRFLSIRPCVVCLRPTHKPVPRLYGLHKNNLTCDRCYLQFVNTHLKCCNRFVHSISDACFRSFRDRFDLPEE